MVTKVTLIPVPNSVKFIQSSSFQVLDYYSDNSVWWVNQSLQLPFKVYVNLQPTKN